MHIPFSKYSGCGNDFILIDNRQSQFDATRTDVIVHLCHRRLGIGADGIVLLIPSSKADFGMRIFNADGSEAEMCGNGLRCLVRYIKELGISGDAFLIETMHQLIPVCVTAESIKAEMPPPINCQFFDQLDLGEKAFTVHFLDTGVPHAVIFVENLQDSELMTIAPSIRHHPRFKPKGTNVNFALIHSNNEVEVRTYERGVEGETLACGTGAAAVAVAASCVHGLLSPVAVRPKSGDTITIAFNLSSQSDISKLWMSGPAIKVFSGIFSIERN